MISDWRRVFGQGDFPFYIVSLAAYKQHKDTPDEDSWAELRAAQDFVANTVSQFGIGGGHRCRRREGRPSKRQEGSGRTPRSGGSREALWQEHTRFRPALCLLEENSGALKLSFTHTDGGLVVNGDKPEEFSICGEDRKWHWADARIAGENVVVSSSEVPNPVAARYAWQANPKATLFNGAGLPAIPFQTDDGIDANQK